MTRFARAKGSKASNERLPNEATPWHVMKQQLEDNATTKKGQNDKAKSAKELLKEKDDPFYFDTTGSVKNDWAEFEVPVSKKNKSKEKRKKESDTVLAENGSCTVEVLATDESSSKKKSKKMKNKTSVEKSVETPVEVTEEVVIDRKEKKKQRMSANLQEVETCSVQDVVTKDSNISPNKMSKKRKSTASYENTTETVVKQQENAEIPKKNKKKEKADSSIAQRVEVNDSTKEKDENVPDTMKSNGIVGKLSKRQKRNKKRKNNNLANNETNDASEEKPRAVTSGGFDATGNDWGNDVNFGKQKFEKHSSASLIKETPKFKKPLNNFNSQQANNGVKRKAPKIRDDGEHKRRKPDPGSIKCIINGMEIEIVKYDGFPVKKEDAERLKELKQNMIMKGIPKSDIDSAMKLERRKAEKALARVKKQVCFHCRKAGHNLSDCPELGQEEAATGICFKCGSTEHTHFECKVTKKEEFRFASCFICREQGHIAKQCPDNPKGLYPQGGACKICGDVTHLKKDCPDLTKEKEESTVTLNTITDSKLESLDEDETTKNVPSDDKKPKSKVVKF